MAEPLMPSGLDEMRRLVADELTRMGWQMVEDDEGALMLKIDGFLDGVITATTSALAGLLDARRAETGGEDTDRG